MGEAPWIWSPCRSFGSSKTQRLQEAAGFGQRGSARGWSWGSPLALAEFLKEMNKEVGKSIPVSLLERNRCPGPRVPERTKSHCNTGQKPWEKSITTSICYAKLPGPRHVMGVWLRHPLEGAPAFTRRGAAGPRPRWERSFSPLSSLRFGPRPSQHFPPRSCKTRAVDAMSLEKLLSALYYLVIIFPLKPQISKA